MYASFTDQKWFADLRAGDLNAQVIMHKKPKQDIG